MHPILFKLGFIEVRYYGLMYVIAILVGTYLIKRQVKGKKLSLSEEEVMNFIVATVIGGIVGARLYYVAFNPSFYLANPAEIPAIWHGGLAIHGGMIGGIIVSFFYLRKKKIPFWEMADIVAPAGILGQTFGRFGNFMNGDAHGRPTDMPWGVVFPPGSIAGNEFPGIPIHPTMLYEMAINFSIFLFLWLYLRKRPHRDGLVFAAYMGLYSVGRFIVESFRADSLMYGPIKAAQVLSIVVALAAIAAIVAWKLWQAPMEEPSGRRKTR